MRDNSAISRIRISVRTFSSRSFAQSSQTARYCNKTCLRFRYAGREYRIYLMQQGQMEVPDKPGKISREIYLKALKKNGKLSEAELLRLKVRYFTHGLAFGSEEFVEELFQQYRSHFGEKRK